MHMNAAAFRSVIGIAVMSLVAACGVAGTAVQKTGKAAADTTRAAGDVAETAGEGAADVVEGTTKKAGSELREHDPD